MFYPNAPIAEAVIDLRVAPVSDLSVSDLLEVRTGDELVYPTADPIVTNQVMIALDESTTSTHKQQIGYIFRRQDGRYIHQARIDGFSISQMRPYSRWEEFREEARCRWHNYKKIARPAGIIRAAVRYINRLDIPEPIDDLKQYLKTVPHISEDLPQGLPGYFMQLVVPFSDQDSRAIITETIIQPEKAGFVSIILDIDIFREYQTPVADDQAWLFLETLRILKNGVFEACITDKTRELFQ